MLTTKYFSTSRKNKYFLVFYFTHTGHTDAFTLQTHHILKICSVDVSPVSLDSITVSQHAQYQSPETEGAKWNSAMFNFISSTCALSPVKMSSVKTTYSILHSNF